MDSLEKYLFKRVNVTELNGNVHNNYYVCDFTSADDNDTEKEESIGLMPAEASEIGIELFASEIKSIKLAEP